MRPPQERLQRAGLEAYEKISIQFNRLSIFFLTRYIRVKGAS
jgi:hypothetical protein